VQARLLPKQRFASCDGSRSPKQIKEKRRKYDNTTGAEDPSQAQTEMKNQTQVTPDINSKQSRSQVATTSRGKDRPQLQDSGAILFDSLYDDTREKSFDEAVCLFKALLELIKHHPGMEQEHGALALIVRGDEQLRNCQAVKRSRALTN
jgi:hypothetical protein